MVRRGDAGIRLVRETRVHRNAQRSERQAVTETLVDRCEARAQEQPLQLRSPCIKNEYQKNNQLSGFKNNIINYEFILILSDVCFDRPPVLL